MIRSFIILEKYPGSSELTITESSIPNEFYIKIEELTITLTKQDATDISRLLSYQTYGNTDCIRFVPSPEPETEEEDVSS